MSRICRMIFGSTCVASFVCVLFYVQSLFQPEPVQQRAPSVEPCCKKESRSALQELYNPTQEWEGLAVLHEARREQVADACRLSSAPSRTRRALTSDHSAPSRTKRALTPADLKHLVVDDDHQLIYCYVPKVACTNWKRVMMVLGGRGRYRDPMEIPSNEAHIPSNLRTLDQFSVPEINRRLRTFFKFLFVREPFERLVSAYRNKFTLKYNGSFHKRFGTRIVRRYRANATAEALSRGHDVSFREFTEYLTDPETLRRDEALNEHWQTVEKLCHPCLIHYDLVGKYETLETDANYVLRLIGNNSLTFPSFAKATRTTDAMTAAFFRNISSERRQRLYRLYENDFVLFNYTTPSYLNMD